MDTKNDSQGRIQVLDIVINDLRLTLGNIYAPNSDTPEFFEEVNTKLNEFDNNSKIIGGDFNLVLNVLLDKKGGKPVTHEKCRNYVLKMMNDLDMYDVWR